MAAVVECAERLDGACASRPPSAPDPALTRALRSFVRGRLGDHADGDDLVQETYLRLFHHQVGTRVADVKALCFAIARNLLIDQHRREQRRGTIALDEDLVCPLPSAEVVVAYRRAVTILARALERMPPLRREIFFRRRLDGVTTADIAHGLDMSTAAVEKHVTRALADLRLALARRGFTMEDGA